ncbi:MAG TPA: TonB-dependent receptor [Vicinamibacterales bacterium]|nr:TonB-dependent receptor [Vicinamibacterales bacterium]
MQDRARLGTLLLLIIVFTASFVSVRAAFADGQAGQGLVVDQTGLPLPGATVQLMNGADIVTTVSTAGDGTFAIDPALKGDTLVVSLDGFETARVERASAAKIVLSIGRTAETTTVIALAPTIAPSSPTTSLLGSTLTASTVSRMPSSRLKARESLPLLPSVVRGPDGLMQLGGARAHETPVLLDGFNVTDPATGNSSLNLPFEAVRGVDALRDPMAVTYGDNLGGIVQIASRTGGDKFAMGIQGFVPRPRFASPGFGRLEGIFPRVHASGPMADGRAHYVAAVEYDYERIPVPDVTQGQGPDIVERSAIVFGRIDFQASPRNEITLEGFAFPGGTDSSGLSPRRDDEATANLSSHDLFGGITDRFVVDSSTLLTVQVGALVHDADMTPRGIGVSHLSPAGWRGNWFSTLTRQASRIAAIVTWERTATLGSRSHDLTFGGRFTSRRLTGNVADSPIFVDDSNGRTLRTVTFGPATHFAVRDYPMALLARDVVHVNDRLQFDLGVRLDHRGRHRRAPQPSGRFGVRYALDSAGLTVIKGGYGSFVGNMPLGAEAFGQYPTRVDRSIDPETGDVVSERTLEPMVDQLRQPRALAATIGLERQLMPRLDASVSVSSRHSTRLPTLTVPTAGGLLFLRGDGVSTYREVQISARRTFEHDQQVFVSYVRSFSRGELNDFAALTQGFDVPLLQPGGSARLAADAPNRVLAWGTFNLPRRIVVSPVVEWRDGFPYSALDARYFYSEAPNSRRFPTFFSTDLVVYKTFTAKGRNADIGFQLFNATNYFNPRDVYPVVGDPRFGTFTNSVGPILRGYMLLKW